MIKFITFQNTDLLSFSMLLTLNFYIAFILHKSHFVAIWFCLNDKKQLKKTKSYFKDL